MCENETGKKSHQPSKCEGKLIICPMYSLALRAECLLKLKTQKKNVTHDWLSNSYYQSMKYICIKNASSYCGHSGSITFKSYCFPLNLASPSQRISFLGLKNIYHLTHYKSLPLSFGIILLMILVYCKKIHMGIFLQYNHLFS